MTARATKLHALSGIFFLMVICSGYASGSGDFEEISETGVTRLRVEASMLEVDVKGGDGMAVEGKGVNIPKGVDVKYERIGGLLHVRVERRFSLFSINRGGELQFEVPAGINLEIRSSSGEIRVRETEAAELFAGASSGNVHLTEIRSPVVARSSSGSLVLEQLTGNVRAESSSGDIRIHEAFGVLDVSSTSGTIRLSDIRGDIDASSSSGKIEFDSVRGKIIARSSSGNIEGEDVWITGDSSFHASSGDIDMDFDNPLTAFTFNLSSSSGRLRIGDLSGEKSLAAGSGKYDITGDTSSGGQRYR